MPAYDYQCECGMTLTIVRGMSDEEQKPICIGCAKVMKRSYDPPPIQFKGTGWAGKDK
jgi:putative FmdB family regulatory protein